MTKIVNLNTLGTEYTVCDVMGNIINSLQIISAIEIVEAGIGLFEEHDGITTQEYLDQSRSHFSGHKDIDPLKVLWWATKDAESDLTIPIEYALNHGYEKIIMECLPTS